ncbi:hypothetical protein DXG01_014562 [Tephrocybe rancida]|nr:hypothetical protein DXG01_014562 [Tephrocybe rancida]
MRRFLVGDDLGNIKAVTYSPDAAQDDVKTKIKTLWNGSSNAVQVLAAFPSKLAAGFSSGSASVFSLPNSDTELNADLLEEVCSWKETRLKEGQKYIGLDLSEKCASLSF